MEKTLAPEAETPTGQGAKLPRFFGIRQHFSRTRVTDIRETVWRELEQTCLQEWTGMRIAITCGSRGVANIAEITRTVVEFVRHRGGEPFIVPAMGSHGGATAEGQLSVLAGYGVTEANMGCPILSSMEVELVCEAKQGFPVYLDRYAFAADGILVVNRIKPHTRFAGAIESGLMKMMLIGLGKQTGAEVYHRVIHDYDFDQIVRAVAQEVIQRCNVLAGLAICENAYEETAAIKALPAGRIEIEEPKLLSQVKAWMPKLPFDEAELLIVDQIGKNISGTGMDTNVIGRKFNDHAAINGDSPSIHHVYVRALTEATHGNASGIGLAELCHQRVLDAMNEETTRMNCITAGHVTGAMLPLRFPNDRAAIETACKLAGYLPPEQVPVMWITDTLHLDSVKLSEAYLERAQLAGMEIVQPLQELQFDDAGDLLP